MDFEGSEEVIDEFDVFGRDFEGFDGVIDEFGGFGRDLYGDYSCPSAF